jgi:exodeoxyribonuclease V beta subunit
MEAADEAGLVPRVLGLSDGERHLTDLRHLAELMHEVSLRQRLGLAGLIDWLYEERRAEAGDRLRRLDSDAAAVQVVTVHGSKGLQYPVVYLPFLHSRWVPDKVEVARFHDAGGVRSLDVAVNASGWAARLDAHLQEEEGESLRKLYVALTRAQSQVVSWWAPTTNTVDGALHRLLFNRSPGQAEIARRVPVPEDAGAWATLTAWAEAGGPALEVAEPAEVAKPQREAATQLPQRRRFDRTVDTDWRRTSYSGLLRVDEPVAGVASEPEIEALTDEPDPGVDEDEAAAPILGAQLAQPDLVVASPMADLPVGATFGSLVHAALEVADPSAADFGAELELALTDQLRWWQVEAEAGEIAAGLLPSQLTPLGPIADGLSLAQIPLVDRLREWEFEFPLAGGEAAPTSGYPTLRDLAATLASGLGADDPLVDYPAHLAHPPLGDQPLKGYLSGSIDAVLRIPDRSGGHRYVVVDYKTNVLGDGLSPMTSADYTREAMAAAMIHSHYPLQALLYSVVLHRYLRWRLPSYDPAQHLGGAGYLFLRGMCGPDTPTDGGHPTGVFAWQPGAEVVVALSDLLAGFAKGAAEVESVEAATAADTSASDEEGLW